MFVLVSFPVDNGREIKVAGLMQLDTLYPQSEVERNGYLPGFSSLFHFYVAQNSSQAMALSSTSVVKVISPRHATSYMILNSVK